MTRKQPGTGRTNTVVVGASAAGLAVGACLQKQHIPFILLEKSNQVAAPWRNHYDRLHLHTDRGNSQLPYLPMPRRYPKYPARAQVVEYLETYARHFGLEPEFGQAVACATRQDGLWQTQTRAAQYESANLVVATGYTRVPNVPAWPGQADFQGQSGTVQIIATANRMLAGGCWWLALVTRPEKLPSCCAKLALRRSGLARRLPGKRSLAKIRNPGASRAGSGFHDQGYSLTPGVKY